MKNISLIFLLGLFIYSCSTSELHHELKDGKEKLEYLINQKKLNSLNVDQEETWLTDEGALEAFSKLSYETIDSMVIMFTDWQSQEAFLNTFEENGKLEEFKQRMQNVKSEEDLNQVIRDFPVISEKTGLNKN